ncbi:hypothetical protein AAKU55_001085 [Oxalobacteraceae bacterium GrIS 1.11]
MLKKQSLALLLASTCALPHAFCADLIAVGRLSAEAADLSTATAGPLENGMPGNLLGGLGSALAYAGNNTFIAMPDRGPNATSYNTPIDNTTSYITRFQTVSMVMTESPSGSALAFKLSPKLSATTLLSSPTALVYGSGAAGGGGGNFLGSGVPALNDATHNYFTGRSDNFDGNESSANPNNGRFDPEAVRVSKDGRSVFVADEYGPNIYQFERATGRRIAVFALPSKFEVSRPKANGDAEIAANPRGRLANKGMEGLAITPDGKTLVGIMQANLAQDAKGMLRIVTIDIASKATREYAYQLTSGSGVSEIVALNDHQFLVDERDGKGLGDQSKAVVKQLFLVDLKGASDVSAVESLSAAAPAVGKVLFLDLVSLLKAKGYSAADIPAKIEGLAFGADVTIRGVLNHTLYVTNDNDFQAQGGDNTFFVFGLTDADLARAGVTYAPQSISPVPEPAPYSLLLIGLGAIGFTVRRARSEVFRKNP